MASCKAVQAFAWHERSKPRWEPELMAAIRGTKELPESFHTQMERGSLQVRVRILVWESITCFLLVLGWVAFVRVIRAHASCSFREGLACGAPNACSLPCMFKLLSFGIQREPHSCPIPPPGAPCPPGWR